ncbi:MAG: YiiX/YebB-like N1pC/P60 family cysteine hydrolase [Hyphomicrobiaceae bacterium]|nr:YiiX/YebB-like N1pC/P60 family cysteine hydrolase [Hyphomicrobiaceae bacterium]
MDRVENAASLGDDLLSLQELAGRNARTPDELAAILQHIYWTVYDVDLNRYDAAETAKAAPYLMQTIFGLRMTLRNRIMDWASRGLLTLPAESALRDVFRIARYGSDMLGELAIGFDRFGRTGKGRRVFTGTDHNTLVNPAYYAGSDLPYRSGDVLLMRGSAYNSAAIARIGDVDTQFSHVGMIHVDSDGHHSVVEALIEDGAVITPLEHALDCGIGRAVLYRCRDEELARRAADLIFEHVKKSNGPLSRRIVYDFSMELPGYKKLYCSKLVRQAFDMASNGEVMVPAFTTRLHMNNRDFFDRIGVTAEQTFAPGDIDLDPRFDLVAEWQDYRLTSTLRLQDMLMTKLLEWMERRGFVFEEDIVIRLVALLGKGASLLSEDAKTMVASVVPKVPRNMSRRTIATIAMLHRTGEELLGPLDALEQNTIRNTGRPLHPRDIFEHLERVREISGGRIGYLVEPRAEAA